MSDYIPPEVLAEILSRLPLKTIIQCRCVCKSWYSIIATPAFIGQHLKNTIANATSTGESSGLYLFRYHSKPLDNGKELYFIYPDDNFVDPRGKIVDCPFRSVSYYVNIVGSCNGVFCLVDDLFGYNHRAALWNPSVKKVVNIPSPSVSFMSHGPFMHSLGFGFDSIADDYKLVRLVYLKRGIHGFDEVPPLVEVYSLRNGFWRMVVNDLKYVIWQHSLSVFLNGSCHWVGNTPRKKGDVRNVIVSFDLGDDSFGEFAVPDCFAGLFSMNMTVAVCNGLLSLVPFFWQGGHYPVWVMKEYGVAESWTKLFNIERLDMVQRLIAFKRNGEVLLAQGHDRLISYDPIKGRTSDTSIHGDVRSFYLDNFMETLVLLNEPDGVLDEDAVGHQVN